MNIACLLSSAKLSPRVELERAIAMTRRAVLRPGKLLGFATYKRWRASPLELGRSTSSQQAVFWRAVPVARRTGLLKSR